MAGRRHGSAGMRARRAAPAPINPCPPGQRGGGYRPLDDGQVAAVVDTALRILDEIGLGDAPAVLSERACDRGAHLGGDGRLRFPRALVEDVVAGAARRFVLHGREPRYDIEIGGERVWFGTGGAAVRTLDIDSGSYRPSTLRDLYDFARLADTLDNVSWFTRCCVATDIDDLLELDLATAYALLRGTRKPIGTSFGDASHVGPVVELFDQALGGSGRFRARPFCQAHISPIISPLRFGEDAVHVALACIRERVPINAIVAAQSGATAPAAPAGMLAATLAETLAALVMVNLFERGYPMVFSNWPLVIDLRSGAFAGGGGEISLLNAAAAQLANHLGLPSGVACSMSDAKAVDAQMGMEKALSSLLTGMAGANMVYESAGMSASLLGASFEAFVADNEMLSHVQRILRGIEVDEELLGFEAIRRAVSGDGHFLGAGHTLAAMQRDYFYPQLADRSDPASWAEQGSRELAERARDRARDILDRHHPRYLDDDADAFCRRRIPAASRIPALAHGAGG